MRLKIGKEVYAQVKRLVCANIFAEERNALELACALGLRLDEKKQPEEPVSVKIKDFDSWNVLSVVATAKNEKLLEKEEVADELAQYIQGGAWVLQEKIDFKELYEKTKRDVSLP